MSSGQDHLRYLRRKKSQTKDAGDIAPVESLGACDVADSASFATDDPAEPLMGAPERLDEIGVGGVGGSSLIKNNELGFDTSPPKPNRHLDQDRSTGLGH